MMFYAVYHYDFGKTNLGIPRYLFIHLFISIFEKCFSVYKTNFCCEQTIILFFYSFYFYNYFLYSFLCLFLFTIMFFSENISQSTSRNEPIFSYDTLKDRFSNPVGTLVEAFLKVLFIFLSYGPKTEKDKIFKNETLYNIYFIFIKKLIVLIN